MTARTAPTLRRLAASEWNFYGVAGEDLTGAAYRDAEEAAWRACSRELRALLAEIRLSRRWWGTPVEMIPEADRVRMARLRLDRTRAPRGAGKGRGRA